MKPANFKKIGTYFREKRLARGLTQEEVSGFLGYTSKQIISNWERGLCSPPLNQVSALIVLFNLDAKEVLELFLDITRAELSASFGVRAQRAKVRKSS
jgi:transcriptional regulator with XRE-family HTH domain